MGIRDLLVLIIALPAVPISLVYPFIGLLAFSWLAYMRPQDMAWGVAAQFRLSFYVAIATMIGMILNWEVPFFRRKASTLFLILFWGWITLSVLFAVDPSQGLDKYIEFSKIILISLLTTGLVKTRERLRWIVLVIGFSLGFLGLKYGLFGFTHGGEIQFKSGVGGLIRDNNDFALALNMALPFLVFLAKDEQDTRWKLIFWSLVPFTIATIVFTYSRGGFLALIASLGLCILRSRRKAWVLVVAPVTLYLFLLFAPARYLERINTIFVESQEEWDSSIQGRLNAWKAAINISEDRPLFGVGVGNFRTVFYNYAPDPENWHVVHNSYLQLLSDAGYPALGLYLILLGISLWTLWKTRRLVKLSRVPDSEWIIHYSFMFEIALIAFIIGGTFLDRAFFDLTYHIIALTACLQILAQEHLAVAGSQGRQKVEGKKRVGRVNGRMKEGKKPNVEETKNKSRLPRSSAPPFSRTSRRMKDVSQEIDHPT